MAELKNLFLPNTVVVQSTVSPDKQVITTSVQSLLVELVPRAKPIGDQPLRVGTNLGDPPLVASQSTSLFAQFAEDGPDVKVNVQIMGAVNLQPGCQALLVSRIAGSTFLDNLTCADNQGFCDYNLTHIVSVAPKNGMLITLFMLVDRTIVDGGLPGGVATVESIELSLDIPAPTPTIPQ